MLQIPDRNQRRMENANAEGHLDADLPLAEQEQKRVLCIPYVPGISDRLKLVANRYNIKSWYSYGGRLGDGLSATYKDRLHESKKRHAVYRASCTCGTLYLGETQRNLKVRIREHNSATSVSALSEHLRIGCRFDRNAHKLDFNRTASLFHEKHTVKRKFLESLAIRYGPDQENVCNNGPSLDISEMWFGCVLSIRTALLEVA